MVSGILWIPDFKCSCFILIKLSILASTNQVHKIHLGTINPIEKVGDCYD